MRDMEWDWEQIEYDLDDSCRSVMNLRAAARYCRVASRREEDLIAARNILTKVLTAMGRLDYVREMIERELPATSEAGARARQA